MKKVTLFIVALLVVSVAMQARTLRFVYIAHDVTTPVEPLVEKLEGYFDQLEDEADDETSVDRTILYLSSGSNPFIVNMESGNRDDDNFNTLVSELYERNFHDVDAENDVEKIIELLSDNDFMTEDNRLAVSNLKFEFYVTPTFWTMGQNQSLIMPLFHTLEIDRFYDEKSPEYNRGVTFKIFLPSVDAVNNCMGPDGEPFGKANVDGINQLLSTPDFIGTYE